MQVCKLLDYPIAMVPHRLRREGHRWAIMSGSDETELHQAAARLGCPRRYFFRTSLQYLLPARIYYAYREQLHGQQHAAATDTSGSGS